jgi:hypothetical protein
MMGMLMRWIAAPGIRNRRHVAEQVERVIDQVIFDMGAGRLVQGTFQLDRRCRPRFIGSVTHVPPRAQASITLAQLPESAPLAGQDGDAPRLRAHTAALAERLLREFHAQSARFRALPA